MKKCFRCNAYEKSVQHITAEEISYYKEQAIKTVDQLEKTGMKTYSALMIHSPLL
jgi:hypothetical protein